MDPIRTLAITTTIEQLRKEGQDQEVIDTSIDYLTKLSPYYLDKVLEEQKKQLKACQ